jgi:hypothetical protein
MMLHLLLFAVANVRHMPPGTAHTAADAPVQMLDKPVV